MTTTCTTKNTEWNNCENVFRHGGGRWTAERCWRRATTTVVNKDGTRKHVCGVCTRRMTTGRDQNFADQWRVEE